MLSFGIGDDIERSRQDLEKGFWRLMQRCGYFDKDVYGCMQS